MDFRRAITGIFGRPYRHALFYDFPGGLRFALSEGSSALDQALSALAKATVICRDIFSDSDQMLVHLAVGVPAARFEARVMLRELARAGIIVPAKREVWIDSDIDNDGCMRVNCAFAIPVSKLQNLLWCAISYDLAELRPAPGCKIYLLHLGKGIVAHPYDDRGMDIIARSPSALVGLYNQHHDKLLPYDMAAMRLTFDAM